MTQSKIITANFSSQPTLLANRPGLEGYNADGFRFTLLSDPATAWQVLGSSNFSNWQFIGSITNNSGEAQFNDASAANLSRRFYRVLRYP